jgi:hypothetical protein
LNPSHPAWAVAFLNMSATKAGEAKASAPRPRRVTVTDLFAFFGPGRFGAQVRLELIIILIGISNNINRN